MRPRVLLVEDEPTVRTLGVRLLERIGFEAVSVTSVESATGLIQRESFAVILVDMDLPDGDGAALALVTRTSGANPLTPVVAVSGSMSEAARRRFTEAGGTACIDKPYTLASLRGGLAPWSPRHDADETAVRPASVGFDPSPLRDVAGDDRVLLQRIVEVFTRDARLHVAEYAQAISRGDATEAERRMHQLAGAAGMVGATSLFRIARGYMHVPATKATLEDVQGELERVLPMLAALVSR